METIATVTTAVAGAIASLVGLVHVTLALVDYIRDEDEEIEAEAEIDDEDEDANA